MVASSVADPDLGSAFFYPGYRIRDEQLGFYFFEYQFLGKIYLILWCGFGFGFRDFVNRGSGMENNRFLDPGSGISIPDPQVVMYTHYYLVHRVNKLCHSCHTVTHPPTQPPPPFQLQSADTHTQLDEDNLEPFFIWSLLHSCRPVRQVCFKVSEYKRFSALILVHNINFLVNYK